MTHTQLKDYDFVSLIIPTKNEEEYLTRFLNSLVKQTYPKDKFEVLIFDGLSTDRTLEIVNKYKNKLNIRVFKNKKIRQVFAFNEGIKKAKGDYVFIIGAHTSLDKDFIKNSVRTFEKIKKKEKKLAGVGGYLEKVYENKFGRFVGLLYSSFFSGASTYHYSKKPGFRKTVVYALYDKEIVKKVGSFDEDFITGQDAELNLRLNKKGYKLYHNPEIKSYYYPRSSFKRFLKQSFNYGAAKGILIRVGYINPLWFAPLGLVLTELLALFKIKIFIYLFLFYLFTDVIASLEVLLRKKDWLALLLPFGYIFFHNLLAVGFLKGLIKGRRSFR